jgi:hypothetical protein
MIPLTLLVDCTEWMIRVTGDNFVMLGVGYPLWKTDPYCAYSGFPGFAWYENMNCFGIDLSCRAMYFGGVRQERTDGPDSFRVPCDVMLLLDQDAKALRVQVEEVYPTGEGANKKIDLGAVCTTMPVDETGDDSIAATLAVGPGSETSTVTIISYKES